MNSACYRGQSGVRKSFGYRDGRDQQHPFQEVLNGIFIRVNLAQVAPEA